MKTRTNISGMGTFVKQILPALLFCTGLFTSCDYLDFDESVGYDNQQEVYAVFTRAEQSLAQLYTYMESDFGAIDGAMRDAATDDAQYVWSNSAVHTFNNGRWSAVNPIDAQWQHYYQGIRAANQFIYHIEHTDYSKYEWNKDYESWMKKLKFWVPEARALRSLFLLELGRRYGDIPLATEIYTEEDVNSVPKSTFLQIVAYIDKECSEAARLLPVDYMKEEGRQSGRITRGAALAIRARALLYAASPLHNPSNDLERWKAAACAAYEIMQLKDGNTPVYELVEEESVNNLNSRELILERRMKASCAFEKLNFPISFDKGNTGTCPSQNLVDAFQTINGKDVYLTEDGWKSNDPQFDPHAPYAHRDKRFYKTILFDGAQFKGKTLDCSTGGEEGQPAVGASPTGYYLKKYIREDVTLSPVEKPMNHYWVLFRYAETLLSYAEAMNNAYGPDATAQPLTTSALEALNRVRARAGMPVLGSGMSRQEFQKAIERERRVEFAFENQRFWDIRRWKLGDTATEICGVKIDRQGSNKTYHRIVVESRNWDEKMNLYPIPMDELYKNKNLLPQNPGW